MLHRTAIMLAPVMCLACSTPPEADALQGVWLSNGYGMAAVVEGGRVASYAIAGGTCLLESRDPLWGVLREVIIEVAPDGQSFQLGLPGDAQRITFNREPRLPAACATPRPDTATGNFEAFVDIFAAHYAFFDLYGVDWQARTAAARGRVSDGMADEALFAVLSDLVAPLQDGHIGLSARINGTRYLYEPNPGTTFRRIAETAEAAGADPEQAQDAATDAFWLGNVQQAILGGNGVMAGDGMVQYGLVNGQTGYIALLTAAGFYRSEEGYLEEDIAAINAVLDDALTLFAQSGAEAVIIDLSLNFGGYDEAAVAIASRFAAAQVVAYSEYPADAAAPVPFVRTITPASGPSFTGPLYVVTSDMTVSAGEIMTLALRALPQTIHVGAPTRGAFSDVLEKQLPNGWQVELSNEVYADHRGIVWEGRGIEPDWPMEIFDRVDPMASHRAAISQLVARIARD